MLSAGSTRQQIFTAVQSNTKHQYALEKYSQRLTAELQEIDKLLAAADVGDSDNEQPGDVEIQGASRATGPIPEHEFLNPVSPFFSEAIKRSRYCKSTVTHAMRPKELDTLTDAVTAEFRRLRVLEGQGRRVCSASSAIDLTSNTDRLNWKTIAEKVSDASYFLRSDRECKTKWLGYQHPGICHDDWTLDELKKLKEIVAEKEKDEEYELDWVDVAQELGTSRTPIDCMRHGFKRVNHTWAPEADRKLFEAVQVYGTENWALVAIHVSPNVTSVQCQMRYNRSLDPLLNKSPWSSAEDKRLNEIVSVLGSMSWPEVARLMPGRTNEMCRERYLERSKAKGQVNKGKAKAKAEDNDGNSVQETEGDEAGEDIARSAWTKEEDEELVRMVGEMGNKWQKISTATGGVHTNVQCRTRYKKLKNGTLSTDTNRSSHSVSITNDQPSKPSAPPPPDLSPNACLSLAPSGSRHAFSFITSDSHPPILQLVPTSIAQSSTSPNVSVAQPSESSLALAKPRPKPKSKAKTNVPQSMTSHTNTTHDSHDNEQQLFSSNSAVNTSSVISSSTTPPPRRARKRPSHRRTVVLSTAIIENLESLAPTRDVTSVPSQAQIRGWEAQGHSSIERQVTGWGAEGQLKGREAESLVQGWEGEGRVREWEANTNSALKIITGEAAEVISDIEGPVPSERTGSHSFATGSPFGRKRRREESSDTMSLSASKNTVSVQNNNSSEAGVESATNIEHDIGNTLTPQRRPARKKERSRKSTADWGVVPVSPTTSSRLTSTPASGSSTLRRSARLAGKS